MLFLAGDLRRSTHYDLNQEWSKRALRETVPSFASSAAFRLGQNERIRAVEMPFGAGKRSATQQKKTNTTAKSTEKACNRNCHEFYDRTNKPRTEYRRAISRAFYAYAGLERLKRRISIDKALDEDVRRELDSLIERRLHVLTEARLAIIDEL